MNSAFLQYVFSGLSFRAYAARFGISVSRLLCGITGISEIPPELTDPAEVRQVLRARSSTSLYVAMKGPRGSVRWHQWVVEQDVGLTILHDQEEFQTARKEPGRLYIFPTVDNLIVAINPQHLVTAMLGGEDTRFAVEQKALLPSLLVSGEEHLPETQTQLLQKVHFVLKQAAESLAKGDSVQLSDYPGYSDLRPSQAYLLDLKTPFSDHLWASNVADEVLANHETICSQLGSAIHGDDRLYLPMSATIVDDDDTLTHVLLPLDQISVLQASRWSIERSALARSCAAVSKGEEEALAQEIQTGCLALGLFGADEIDEYVAKFRETLAADAPVTTVVDVKDLYDSFIAAGDPHLKAAVKTARQLNKLGRPNPNTAKGVWHGRHVEMAVGAST